MKTIAKKYYNCGSIETLTINQNQKEEYTKKGFVFELEYATKEEENAAWMAKFN